VVDELVDEVEHLVAGAEQAHDVALVVLDRVPDVPDELDHRRRLDRLDGAALLARVEVLLLALVDVADLRVDDVEDLGGEPVGVREHHVLVDVGIEEEVGVGALPRVDDLVVVAGDEHLLHVRPPLLEDVVLQRRDVLELVDDQVVDVGDERALRDPFEHVGEADEVVVALVAAPRADRLGDVDPVVVGGPRRGVLVPLLGVGVLLGGQPDLLDVPLEGDVVPVGDVALGALEPL